MAKVARGLFKVLILCGCLFPTGIWTQLLNLEQQTLLLTDSFLQPPKWLFNIFGCLNNMYFGWQYISITIKYT